MPWVTSATGVADEVRPATGGKRTAYAAPVTTESRRKLSVFAPLLLALLSSVGPFAIDTAFPAFPQMGRELAVGGPALQWTISAYLFAFGVMSIFHGPLSDALGRRPVIIGGMALFALASVGCALAPSLPMLLFFRVLQGLSAGGGVIVSRTVIRDVYEGSDAQRLMSRVTMIFALAPAIAPILGGYLLQFGTWRWIFWFLTGFGFLLVACVLLFLPETHPVERRVAFRPGPMVRSLVNVLRSGPFHVVAWATTLAFAGQFLYVGAAAIFVVDLLGKGETDFWVLFVPVVGGMILGSAVSSRAAGRISGRALVSAGLTIAVVAAAVNVALSLLPTAANLPYAVLGPTVIAFGVACSYPTLQLAMLDMFPATRGAVTSAATFMTLMFNSVLTGVIVNLVSDSVLHLAVTSFGLVLGGFLLWTWHIALVRRELRVNPDPLPDEPQI